MTTPPAPLEFPIPPDVEGFWSWEKGHFPRPATPLTQEILYGALSAGFSRAMHDWACPFGVECRAINYYGFLALKPFDLGTATVEDRGPRYQVAYLSAADNYFAPKPGTMPPTQSVLEGARPWSHTCFTTNSLC